MPPQHGAWAFVGLPILLGLAAAPWTPWLIPAGVGWVLGYPVSFFSIAVLRYPRPARFRRPWLIWTALATPLGIAMVLARPWLVWVGCVYLAAFAANVAFARRRDERSLSNDTIFILECTAIIPVSWGIGAIPGGWSPLPLAAAPQDVWLLAGLCLLALGGSTLHVKSLIRERTNPHYAHASRWWAFASLAVSAAAPARVGLPGGGLLVIPFAYFAWRSVWLAHRDASPARIGMLELVGFALLAALAPPALP